MSAAVTTSCYSAGHAVNCATKYSYSIGGLIAIHIPETRRLRTPGATLVSSLSVPYFTAYVQADKRLDDDSTT